jgi:hypothetical protein
MPPPEFAELDTYRLDRDWTWAELSAAMGERDIQMSPRTLHYLLKAAPADAKPHDRTLHKIQKFLAHTRQASQRRARRARKQIATRA